MPPQCVSCNNQPNDNDSLGGAASEGAVTPVVIGIIVGTVGVFVVVLCALFYCVKLENERSLRVKDDDDNDDVKKEARPRTPEAGDGRAMHVANDDNKDDDDDNDNDENDGDDDNDAQTLGRGCRPPSSAVAAEGARSCAEEVVVGVAVEKRGLFKWVGKKAAGGNSAPADSSPVTVIEMV